MDHHPLHPGDLPPADLAACNIDLPPRGDLHRLAGGDYYVVVRGGSADLIDADGGRQVPASGIFTIADASGLGIDFSGPGPTNRPGHCPACDEILARR